MVLLVRKVVRLLRVHHMIFKRLVPIFLRAFAQPLSGGHPRGVMKTPTNLGNSSCRIHNVDLFSFSLV